MADHLQDIVLRLRDEQARGDAVASLLEVLQSDSNSRDRLAELNAVPGLVDILHDFLDVHDQHAESVSKKESTNDDTDVDAEVEKRRVRDESGVVAGNALKALIDMTQTVATRLRVVDAGGIGPVCRLMDADVFVEAVAERAVVLLINCCTNSSADGIDESDNPFSPAAKVKKAVAQTGGVLKIINGLKRTPSDNAGLRAVHLLSLLSDEPSVRVKFRAVDSGGKDDAGFAALIPFLEMNVNGGKSGKSASTPIPTHVKHAAVASNNLCINDVPNKELFCKARGIPPLMGLLHGGSPNGFSGKLNVIPLITKTVVDAVSTLAMDNDLCDQVVCDTGVLPSLVSLVGDSRCDQDLNLSTIHAVMHMARDSRDAKRQLTEHGIVPKMRDIVDGYDPSVESSEVMVIPAISCMVNLAVDTEYWGQAELAEEGVIGPVKRSFELASPGGKFAQVCVAFTHAFVKNNPDNGFAAAESGILQLLAYHHLHTRDSKTSSKKRSSQEALVTLGAATDADESAREIVASTCGELLLRECLQAGAGQGVYLPPEITDKKRLKKEKATLDEVIGIAKHCKDGASFAKAADDARLNRKKRRAQEIFDAEAALEKKLVEQLAAREKELLEAEAARVELRKAQAHVGQSENKVKKEVNEARAAKKELEGAQRALKRKIAKEGENSKAVQALRETVDSKQKSWEKERREADEAIAAHSASEAAEKSARGTYDREKAEADAAEREAETALAEKANREEQLDAMDVRARRRFLEQEEAAELAAKKAARAAVRAAERINSGDPDVDIEAAEEEEDEEEEDEDDPFEKKCCVIS